MKTVVITGCSGQDGSYLAELCLAKGYKVIGINTWNSTGNINLKNVIDNKFFKLETGDIIDKEFIHRIFMKYTPVDYFYNLGAISYVAESFKIPIKTFTVNTLAVINILEEIRTYSPKTKFYQASTSEMIGRNKNLPQNTESTMIPNSPYAVAKLASHHMVRLYREAYGLFACSGLLYNHESERRGVDFVTRKITLGISDIYHKKKQFIILGNINSCRDWGHAKDYVNAQILMMEADNADDYTVCTGKTFTIRQFVEEAFNYIGEKITWNGTGLKEVGINQNGIVRVKISKEFYRPAEVDFLKGDNSKILKKLNWKPTITFKELVKMMVKNDLKQ